ncbi:hypothetical protein K6V98_06015 [Collinsella sp. AGMB00827]|uniref:Uncharacterized protein n=1 Tax=Collinsella ureilytica TaxID=2869515 RepID=A0ABS7MLH7_9ACTN|nr:hypothetical protein [Collinsella urealyticum]MBY4797903.1 hypothetical protein [Collinsella urealyticum]
MADDPKAGRLTNEELEELEESGAIFCYAPIFTEEEKALIGNMPPLSEEQHREIFRKCGLV